MPITIKHQPVAAAMTAAYATGVGSAQERQRRERLMLLQRQQEQQFRLGAMAQQEMWSRQRLGQEQTFRAGEAKLDRDFRTDLESDRRSWEAEQADTRWTRLDEQRQKDWERDRDWELLQWEQEDAARVHAGTHAYIPAQDANRARLNKLQVDLTNQVRSGEMNMDDYQDAIKKINRARAMDRPLPIRPGEEPIPPDVQIQRNIRTDEQGNMYEWNAKAGAWTWKNNMQHEMAMEQLKEDYKILGELAKMQKVGDSGNALTPEEAVKYVQGLRQAMAGGGAQPQQSQPAEPQQLENQRGRVMRLPDDGAPPAPGEIPQSDITEITRQMMRNAVLPGEFVMPQ